MLLLPDVRQKDGFDCGTAAVKTVLEFFGVRKLHHQLVKLMGTNQLNGTDPRTIEAFLRGEGLRVFSGEMRLEDLAHFTKTGCPVICLVTMHGSGHYVVAAGVKRNKVWFQDPSGGLGSLTAGDFIDRWVDFDRLGVSYKHFGLVVWK